MLAEMPIRGVEYAHASKRSRRIRASLQGHLPASSTGLAAQLPEQGDVFPRSASPMTAPHLKTCRGLGKARRKGSLWLVSASLTAKRSARCTGPPEGTSSGARGCVLQPRRAVDTGHYSLFLRLLAAVKRAFIQHGVVNVDKPPLGLAGRQRQTHHAKGFQLLLAARTHRGGRVRFCATGAHDK